MHQTLLIVEDDAVLRGGMKMLLSARGHSSIAVAATLAEARQCLQDAAPSHLILDLNLPDGLGTDLLRQIRADGLTTRVLILTGSVDTQLIAEVKGFGVDAVLAKPPRWEQLAEWASAPPAA